MARSWPVSLGLIAVGFQTASAQFDISAEALDHPAIEYQLQTGKNRVTELNSALRAGNAQLTFGALAGYLRSVLAALDVPVESQIAVFSKTSLQSRLIGPKNPRTVFFNDDVAVGWVPGEPFVEVAAQDPRQGVVFYTLDQQQTDRPQFVRRDMCLTCHLSHASLNVPGMLLRSVFPNSSGQPERTLGEFNPDHRSPFGERWGGWFVTGRTGSVVHMGNTLYPANEEACAKIDSGILGGGGMYLSPHSDVAALTVFDHQWRFVNLLTRFGWQIRISKHDRTEFDLDAAAGEIVDYMLFAGEAHFPSALEGDSGFAKTFAASGIRDSKGRSLKDLDLKRRLLRYPCSYMIYTETFDSLPVEGRDAIYKLLWRVLTGGSDDPKYAALSMSDRRAILQILRETKKGLPSYFFSTTASPRRPAVR